MSYPSTSNQAASSESTVTPSAHPYAEFIHLVQKPARYLGGEYQAVIKDWDTVDVRLCMAFPDIYDIGMSHLGTKIIYSLLNQDPAIACERAFAPWVDMEAQLRERQLPVLSLESARPLKDFDVIGFSLQYEMTYTNVLNLLDLSGIPLRSVDRGDDWPLIIGGGPTATHPEPMAPFLDAMLVGDAEEIFPRSLHAIAQWRRDGLSRRDVLRGLAAMGGWYCPALYETRVEPRNDLWVIDPVTSEGPYPVVRAHVEDLSPYPFPTDTPIPAAEAIFDRVSMEIARGCTEGCRFCQAGMIYRPVRERDPEQIVDAVMEAIDKGGYDEVSLTSLSTADYSCISPLIKTVMKRVRERRVSLSVSSLRAYGLDEDLLDEISSVKATGLTFAPEAGTQRMRDVVNKNVTDEDINTTAERVFARGWRRMKLYFMIGLPTEEDEDVAGIIETAGRIRRIGAARYGRKVEVTASASSHVPKPHTPFQWAAMDSVDDIRRKQGILKDLARRARVNVKVHDERISYLEGIVARGDRTVGDLIELAWQKGCRFDGWDEVLKWEAWEEALAEWQTTGGDPKLFLGTLPIDGALPWDHIDVGLAPKFLFKEWKRSLKDRLSPPCSKPLGEMVHHTNVAEAEADHRKLVCYHCGVACDLGQMRTERIGFLSALGAEAPHVPSEDDAVPQWQTVRKNKRGQRLPPLRADQGEAHPYRLVFTKLGVVSLTSQLDLTRSLPRVLRRAGLRLKYTQGFSPKAVLAYGPALPLGTPSIAEVLDVFALDEQSPADLLARLNQVTDPGMRWLAAAPLPEGAKSCARVAKLAEVVLACPDRWDVPTLQSAASRLLGDEPIEMTVTRKKGPRVIDVRDGLIGVELSSPSAVEVALLGLHPTTPLLRIRTDLNEGAHVRPLELAEAVLGPWPDGRPSGVVAARTGLWGLRKERVFDLLAPGDEPREVAAHASLPRTPTHAAV